MSLVCSIIAIELAIKGNVVEAIIAFWLGIMIDSTMIDALEPLVTIEGGEE